MMNKKYFFFLPFVLIGCQSPSLFKDSEALLDIKMLNPAILRTNNYAIKIWVPKEPASNDTVRVYIEGDGKAWLRSGRASTDPTPQNRLVHRLMLNDPKHDIAYLGRPCQYIITPDNCKPYTWTFGRYDSDIIEAMNSALSQIKHQGHYKNIELVGYSGGATIALLLASRRQDIDNIRTVAGNLDPEFTNKYHKVSPMPSALNPIDFRASLNSIPQMHFYGTEDSVIPAVISSHYQKQFTDQACLSVHEVKKAGHHKGWEGVWGELLQKNIVCKTKKSPAE